jgi:hypothetical protein
MNSHYLCSFRRASKVEFLATLMLLIIAGRNTSQEKIFRSKLKAIGIWQTAVSKSKPVHNGWGIPDREIDR